MSSFHFHADLYFPAKLIDAVRAATGEQDVFLRKGWNVADPEAQEMHESPEPHAAYIEWYRRKGRFSLDVHVYGRNFAPRETSARFCRAMAKGLGSAVLFSDCSPFGYSYFSAEPDGSIWAQLLIIGDDDDVMDLDRYDEGNIKTRFPRMVFRANEELPQRSPSDPDSWTHGDTDCHRTVEGRPCRVFAGPCPRDRIP